MYCRKCGQQISDDSQFCNYCGSSLGASVVQSSQNARTSLPEKRCIVCGNTFYGNGSTCGVCDKKREYGFNTNNYSTLSNNYTQERIKPRTTSSCAIAIIMGGVFLLVVVAIVLVYGAISSQIGKAVGYISSDYSDYDDSNITLAEFNEVETGMSYEEVSDIIGSSGTMVSEAEYAGYHNSIVAWNGHGITGANANISFQNGRVVAKAQFGLQ